MARGSQHDILITVGALATAALLIVLFQSGPGTEVASPRVALDDVERVKRQADDNSDGDSDALDCAEEGDRYDVCALVDEDTGCCVDWSRNGETTSAEEEEAAALRRRKNKKNKAPAAPLTSAQKKDAMDRFKTLASTAARKQYNQRHQDFDLAERTPGESVGAMNENSFDVQIDDKINILTRSQSEKDSINDCLRGSPVLENFLTKRLFISYPTTYDWVSDDKDQAYSDMGDFIDDIASYGKSQGIQVEVGSYFASVPQRFKTYTTRAASIDPVNTKTVYPQTQFGKLFFNFARNYDRARNVPAVQNQDKCFHVVIINDIPKDYGNILRDTLTTLAPTIQRCTIIPVFRDDASAEFRQLFNVLIGHIVPGAQLAYSHDDKLNGYYYNTYTGNANQDQLRAQRIVNGIKAYMCMIQNSAFCQTCITPAYVETPPAAASFDGFPTPIATSEPRSTTDSTETPDAMPDLFDDKFIAGDAPADDLSGSSSECCGAFPYLAESFDSYTHKCCVDGDGAQSTVGAFDIC